MSGDHNQYQKTKSYLNDDFECPRCGHCCQALETEQEPVATVTSESGNPNLSMSWWHEPALPVGTKIYTSPPKREWVGLTADEIWKCNKAKSGSAVEFHICYSHQNVLDFAESIEAKLKEKNGG
jgi:hypothetical protein